MHDTFIAMVSFGILMLIWYFCWRPSILDECRDRLFDLRDEVRDHFINNDIPLDSDDYRHLRDTLNHHLRFAKSASLLSFFCWMVANPEMKTSDSYKFSNEIEEFGNDVRLRAVRAIVDYMVYSSTTMMFVIVTIVAPLFGVIFFSLMLWKSFRAILRGGKLRISAIQRSYSVIRLRAFDRMYNVKQIEGYSNHGALNC